MAHRLARRQLVRELGRRTFATLRAIESMLESLGLLTADTPEHVASLLGVKRRAAAHSVHDSGSEANSGVVARHADLPDAVILEEMPAAPEQPAARPNPEATGRAEFGALTHPDLVEVAVKQR